MNEDDINKANALYDQGLVAELYDLIKPHLESGDPNAYSFYAGFSLNEWNESDEEYDVRYIDCLTKAAEGGVAGAMYRLSTLYSSGDIVEFDLVKAKQYMEGSLEQGYSPAKLTLGLYLFYGANGYEKDLDRARELINLAVEDNVEGADEALKLLDE